MTNQLDNVETMDDLDFLAAANTISVSEEAHKVQPHANGKELKPNTLASKTVARAMETLSDKPLEGEVILAVDPDLVDSNPYQNRRHFKGIEDLAKKIVASEQHQPCVARKVGNRYQIAAGERRLRACKLAGIHVKLVVRDLSDEQMRDICIAENADREDINSFEKYIGIRNYQSEEVKTPDIAERLNISPSTFVRLNKLSHVPYDVVLELSESDFASHVTAIRAEDIGNLYRDFPDDHDMITKKLRAYVEAFKYADLPNEHQKEEEVNKCIKALVREIKGSNAKPKNTPSSLRNNEELTFDGLYVGDIKTSSRSAVITVRKENFAEDKYNQFLEHVRSFFLQQEESPE